MKNELTDNQKKLINMINTWIKNEAISQKFSYEIKGNTITFLPQELQIEWNDFENDICALVESGRLVSFRDDFYISTFED